MTYEQIVQTLRRHIATMEWENDRYGADIWMDRVDRTLADLRADLAQQAEMERADDHDL